MTLKKIPTIALTVVCLIIGVSASSYAGWLIYHKPAFKGMVIDAETKEPIEGAVVLVMYRSHTIISGPGGGFSKIIHIKEVLTDEKGEFYIPSYTSLIHPNSYEYYVDFIIYKRGYGQYPGGHTAPKYGGPETLFTKEIGTKGELQRKSNRGTEVISVTYGVVELPRLTREERRKKGLPGGYSSPVSSKTAPLFFKAINEERRFLGYRVR